MNTEKNKKKEEGQAAQTINRLPSLVHLAKIRELQKELGWDDEKLDTWLMKYFKRILQGLGF